MSITGLHSAYQPAPQAALETNHGQHTGAEAQDARLRRVCHEFESVLFSCMLKSMRQSVDTCDLFSGGRAEEIYTSLLDQEYARSLSGSVSGGIAGALYTQLSPGTKDDPGAEAAGREGINIAY